MYQDAVAQEMQFVLENAGIEYAIVEDQEQVDKLLEVAAQRPHLKHIFYDDPRGLRNYTQGVRASTGCGKSAASSTPANPGFFDARGREGRRG